MKVKGYVLLVALGLGAVGCGGSGGGSSSSINIRTAMLVRGSTSVTISGSQSGNIVSTVTYPAITGFAAYSATPQQLTATDVGVNPNVALGTYNETSLTQNAFYTLYATGAEGSTTVPPTLTLVPETAPVISASASQIRFENLSPGLDEAVDVYCTPIAISTPISSQTPTFAGVTYGPKTGGYVSLSGGAYVITVTQAGNSSNVLYTSPVTTFTNGFIYTNYLVDTPAASPVLYSQQDGF